MRTCPQCGKEFKPVNDAHVYCVKQCRYDYNNARKLKAENDENRVYTQLHGGMPIPDGYILVPEKDWQRLLQMVTDIVMQQATPKKEQASREELPITPFQKPLIINDDDMPIVEVKKSDKPKDANLEFKNSIMSLFSN